MLRGRSISLEPPVPVKAQDLSALHSSAQATTADYVLTSLIHSLTSLLPHYSFVQINNLLSLTYGEPTPPLGLVPELALVPLQVIQFTKLTENLKRHLKSSSVRGWAPDIQGRAGCLAASTGQGPSLALSCTAELHPKAGNLLIIIFKHSTFKPLFFLEQAIALSKQNQKRIKLKTWFFKII